MLQLLENTSAFSLQPSAWRASGAGTLSRSFLVAFFVMVFTFVSCSETPPGTPHDGGHEGYLTWLEDFDDILSLADGDLSVKYLAPLDPGSNPPPLDHSCVFQDMHLAQWHLEFLAGFDAWSWIEYEDYLSFVLRAETRRFWGGSVTLWPEAVHPDTGQRGLVSFSVYAEETLGNELTLSDVVQVYGILTGCMAIPSERLVFVAEGPAQRAFLREHSDELAAAGIFATEAAALAGDSEIEIYSQGTGYGSLVIVPEGQPLVDYGPRDIVVVESAPNDIGIVSGLITSQPQSLHSHVNLRLGEKDIPNVRMAGALESPFLLGLEGRLIRMVATEDELEIDPASPEEAEAWWAAHQPSVGQPQADLSVTEIATFETLGSDDADAYGVKAANLAELAANFGPDHAQTGLAIPFSAYLSHVEANGIDVMIEAFLEDPRRYTDLEHRRDRLDDIRDAIRDAPVDPGLAAALEARIRAWLGEAAETTKLRFRSSTNVEDLDELTGAGLYDSRSGCLGDDLDGDDLGPSRCLSDEEADFLRDQLGARRAELADHPERTWLGGIISDLESDLTEEKPIARALTRVWRSLWNDRAWEEREYYGIDHRLAFMAIAVNPAFVLEQINAVVITNLSPDDRLPLYRVVSQVGHQSVVRPDDAMAIAEVRTVRRGADDEPLEDALLIASSFSPEGSLWDEATFAELLRLIFDVQDHFAQAVYEDESIRLDLEIKLTREGQVVVKQARPYVSGAP
jgi:hypothetical protein